MFEPNLDEELYFKNIQGVENIPLFFENFLNLDILKNFASNEQNFQISRYDELEEQIFLFELCLMEADNKNNPLILLNYLRINAQL